MPFKSEQQRRFLWAKHPEIASKWAHGEHSTKGGSHKEAAQRKLKHMNKRNSSG